MRVTAALTAVVLLMSGCSVFGGNGGSGGDDVFRMAVVRPSSLDPIKAATVDEQLVAEQLFDTLVSVDAATAEPGPGIAESWTTSPDGLQWEFTLDGDASFSNGDPVTAFDVKASLERAVARSSGSAVADLLEPVAGWRDAAVEGTTDALSGIVAVSDDVVRIDLTAPWASLPAALSHAGLGIVPRSEAGSADFDERPVGSGPYVVDDRTDDRLTLRAAPGRAVKSPRVEVRFYDDQGSAYAAFVDGDVHWSPVPLVKSDEAAARYGRKYFRSYLAELFYAFNLRNPKWADRRLREVVVRAVDTRRIIDDVYEGSMAPMTSFVVDGVPGAGSDRCGEVCTHDPERARALVGEMTSQGVVLPEVFVDFEGDPAQTAVAEHIETDLEAVGLTVTLRPKPLDEYERFAVSGEQDLFRLGWIAAYPAADAFVAPLFQSGSANNLPGFGLGSVDQLIGAARATADADQRAVLYEQIEQAVFSEIPILPIGHFQQHWVGHERVRDLELSVSGTFDAATVWLAGD